MNILLLTTYPVDVPRHGGQIRAAEIARFYRQADCQVQVAGVLGSASYLSCKGFVAFPEPSRLTRWVDPLFLMEDVAIGKHFAEQDEAFTQLKNKITVPPDIIHVEQPWLMGFAYRYAVQCNQRPKLVYGSQNIEAPLKQAIVASYFGETLAAQQAKIVSAMESDAIALADAICCVSTEDAKQIQMHTQKKVVVAPNGVKMRPANRAAFEHARIISQGHQYALYCASAHPPNIQGFFDWLGGSIGAFDNDQRLIVAGSAGQVIAQDPRFHASPGMASIFVDAGIVEEQTLAGLIAAAHCMVLPISAGGGTNLKTAEALCSGHHVLATQKAMRGFESYQTDDGVTIAKTPAQFKRQLRQAMRTPPLSLHPESHQQRQQLSWSNCLQSLKALLP